MTVDAQPHYGAVSRTAQKQPSRNNRSILAALAGLSAMLVLVIALTLSSSSSEDSFFLMSLDAIAPSPTTPAAAAMTETKDQFQFSHTFKGYGEGGRERDLVVSPPRVLVGGGGDDASNSASNTAPLPASLIASLAEFGVKCEGTCALPQGVLLLQTLTEFGLHVQTGLAPVKPVQPPTPASLLSVFVVNTSVMGDIKVAEMSKIASDEPSKVIVSANAFHGGEAQQATLDGVSGIVFSLRLRGVVLSLITNFGKRVAACDDLCNRLFDCHFADAIHPNYTALTAYTTEEGPGRFADFLPYEKLEILKWWYYMPPSLHRLPGLSWVVRRGYALEHPFYTYVPAVSWPDNQDESYMEFLDITFSRDCDTMRHLFLHEKTHFYFGRVMTAAQKDMWQSLGGWSRDWNGQWGALGTTTGFVSGYAASVDSNEDIAESVAEYILHPALVRTRSMDKYRFLQNNVMKGYEYLPTFWEGAAFEVQNLHAAEDRYPNPVARVHVYVTGHEFEDKNVTVVLHLHPQHGWTTPITATTDIGPPSGWADDSVNLDFVQDGNTLRAEATVSKSEEYGFWRASQLHIHDALGVTRWIHLDESNWRVYINNKYASDNPLVYKPQSLQVTVDAAVNEADELNAHKYGDVGAKPRITIKFSYQGQHAPYYRWPAAARLVRKDATASYYVEGWGHCPEWDLNGQKEGGCSVSVIMSEFVAGEWYVAQVFMQESTGRSYREFFSSYVWDELPTPFMLPGKGVDTSPPEINTLSLKVKAAPVNAAQPDGETVIEFSFQAKDDQAGLGKWTYRLLDPSGVSHLQSITIATNVEVRPNDQQWQTLTGLLTVPKGSPPGTWGVEEIEVWDRAGNRADLRLVDTRVFAPVASLPVAMQAPGADVDLGLVMNEGGSDE